MDLRAKLRQRKLENYVKQYFVTHPEVRLVVVAGSIGKSQAKTAIATVLAERYRVRMFHGNRGTNFTAPLAILGIDYPGDIVSSSDWKAVFKAAEERIKQPNDVDVIIHELNAAKPGDIAKYASYLVPNLAVITAVSPSNLEVFGTVDAVAAEQLTAVNISQGALINRDDIDGSYAAHLTNGNINTYGTSGAAEYRFEQQDYSIEEGYSGLLYSPEWHDPLALHISVHDDMMVKFATMAAAAGIKMGLSGEQVAAGVAKVRPLAGRMRVLRGIDDSIILDDTANNSPLGARNALRALYQVMAPRRVAVLGSMARLGAISASEHQAIGQLCSPDQLAWVVTVGEEANTHLAPAARSRGCQVRSFNTALEAGAFVRSVTESKTAVLFNAHEDDTFLEEAIKLVLAKSTDSEQLVRQSPADLDSKMTHGVRF